MFNPLLCGSFSNQEEDDFYELVSPCTAAPKRSRKRSRIKSRDSSKNRYANLGLDKFSAVLAELEDKKQKIYTQRGSQGISFVCFVYSKSNAWKPIVVKAKYRKQENDNVVKANKPMIHHNSEAQDRIAIEEASNVVNEVVRRDFSRSPSKKSINLRHPCCYLPLVMVLTLLFLVLYGRSFAIVCTSLGWYLAPMIKERSSSLEKTSKIKKDYVRRLSEKNMPNDGLSSPRSPMPASKSVLSGQAEKTIGLHPHRKSW